MNSNLVEKKKRKKGKKEKEEKTNSWKTHDQFIGTYRAPKVVKFGHGVHGPLIQ